ncbi:MAG TPA: hypothetical protein DD856_06005 [Sulfobacillus sp.]|nr:hypothetical protein [Sulfobacillus sp.]
MWCIYRVVEIFDSVLCKSCKNYAKIAPMPPCGRPPHTIFAESFNTQTFAEQLHFHISRIRLYLGLALRIYIIVQWHSDTGEHSTDHETANSEMFREKHLGAADEINT